MKIGNAIKICLVLLAAAAAPLTGNSQATPPHQPLAQRIGHTDLSKITPEHSHGSVGLRKCQSLVPASAMDVNLNFFLRCQMQPGGGVAEHFHNTVEEMFTILNGEAEFTIDSHTSLVKGPAGAPLRKGHSHAVYNPTNELVDYFNINVSTTKGHYDAENLEDSRDKVTQKDEIPQFTVMRLDKALLKPVTSYHGGQGTVRYRRALGPDEFLTNWAYMDHLLIPAGASEGLHYHTGVEEIYYVMDGDGDVRVNDETAPIHKGDGVPIRFGEAHSFTNNGSVDLELLIIGISAQKDVLDTELGTSGQRGRY
jgi:mannose-6-phosphate isomerase-like protein (cupin superfamily)